MRRPEQFAGHPGKVGRAYRAVCLRVIDGDTYDFMVDLGFYTYAYITVRLAGVDTPEINTKDSAEKLRGLAAKAFATELLLGKPCMLYTEKDAETFGRFVASVDVFDSLHREFFNVEGALRDAGHAVLS